MMDTTSVSHNPDDEHLPAMPFGMLKITDAEFETIRRIVYEYSGINLTEAKRSLVPGRLQGLMMKMGFTSFQQYSEYLANDITGKALSDLISRISTNHTFFFREKDHLDFLYKTALPEAVTRLKQQNSRDLRIWSAGCSFGDEPYTFAILMMEYFGPQYETWNAGVLATDISDDTLAVARKGIYTKDHIEQVPQMLVGKYFRKRPDNRWEVIERLKQEVTYRRFNLMNHTFPFKKPFHVISCRNVMIYFDVSTRNQLVRRFYDMTEPGGYLFTGHSESLSRSSCPYQYVQPAVYRKGDV